MSRDEWCRAWVLALAWQRDCDIACHEAALRFGTMSPRHETCCEFRDAANKMVVILSATKPEGT